MSPTTAEFLELAARDSDGIHVLLPCIRRERPHRDRRGLPWRRSLPTRRRAGPCPRCLLPPY